MPRIKPRRRPAQHPGQQLAEQAAIALALDARAPQEPLVLALTLVGNERGLHQWAVTVALAIASEPRLTGRPLALLAAAIQDTMTRAANTEAGYPALKAQGLDHLTAPILVALVAQASKRADHT